MPRLTPRRPPAPADPRRAAALLLALVAACGGGSVETASAPGAANGGGRSGPRAPVPEVALRVALRAQEDRAPLAGLPVYVWPRRGGAGPRTALAGSEAELGEIPLTGADGAATFQLPPGRYSAAAEWPAEEPLLVELLPGKPAEVELLRPSLPDQACVLSVVGADGSALAGSTVELVHLPPELAARGAADLVRAEGDGRHALHLPSWSAVVAIVRAEGHGEVRLALGPGAEAAPERAVRLERSAAVRGRLVDTAGVPVAGAVVAAQAEAAELFAGGGGPPASARAEEMAWTAATDDGGAFILEGLPANVALTLEAAPAAGAARRPRPRPLEPLRLAPGEEREALVVLAAGTRLAGVLLGADGAPRPGVSIWLVHGGARSVFTPYEAVRDHALTDAEGRFAFEGVEPGSWRVGPAAQSAEADGDAVLAPLPEVVDVMEGMTLAEVVLRPPGLSTVEGRCVGPRGEPVSGVHLVAESAEQVATAISDADGAFSLGPFIEGALELRTTAPSVGYTGGAPQKVSAGDRDVVVRVERSGALRGSTVRASGGAPLGAEIELALRERLRGPGSRRVTAGADGAFTAQDLEPGGYVVVARAERGLVAVRGDVAIAPGETQEVALELVEGARARFFAPADSGASSFLVLVNGVPVERGGLIGREEIETRDFPPGEVTVELHGPKGPVARQAAMATAGSIVQLDFRP